MFNMPHNNDIDGKEVSKEVKEIKKEKKCSCNEYIGRDIRCPLHGDRDKI